MSEERTFEQGLDGLYANGVVNGLMRAQVIALKHAHETGGPACRAARKLADLFAEEIQRVEQANDTTQERRDE